MRSNLLSILPLLFSFATAIPSPPVVNGGGDVDDPNINDDAVANSITSNNRLLGHRGLAFLDTHPEWTQQYRSSRYVSWCYNWNQERQYQIPYGIEYVPMLYSDKPASLAVWKKHVLRAKRQGSRHLLAFNEPDNDGQANMTPARSAAVYKHFFNPWAGQLRLGAPAVTSSGDPGKGLEWLSSFFTACSDCQIDFVPVHWYGNARTGRENFNMFTEYMRRVTNLVGTKPIWVTEFGVTDDTFYNPGPQQVILDFLDLAIPWLQQQGNIERFAYFGLLEGFMQTNGVRNAVGNKFANLS